MYMLSADLGNLSNTICLSEAKRCNKNLLFILSHILFATETSFSLAFPQFSPLSKHYVTGGKQGARPAIGYARP